MKLLSLPGTGRNTSQLGFGGSSLMGAASRRESLQLLRQAYDAGIRHFDVAPMYGYGAAEGCLGEFLAEGREDVTVTTKYGIPAPANPGFVRALRRLAAPALRALPGLKRKLTSGAGSLTGAAARLPFTAEAAERSLHASLRNLCLERVDIFLLHEAEASDLRDEKLLRFLETAVTSGKVGAFGCGSSADKLPALLADKREYCPVIQYEWSILDRPQSPGVGFRIHHRALTTRFADLRSALQRSPGLRARWSNEVGADLAAPGMLAALMLRAALVLNPDGLVLVSSRKGHHLRENARVAGEGSLDAPARKLHLLAQREAAAVLPRMTP